MIKKEYLDYTYSQTWQEMQQLFKKANEEIKSTYEKCVDNKQFKKYTSSTKQVWYYVHLRERIEHKIYTRYQINIYGVIRKVIDSILPKTIENQFRQFIDI